MKGIKVLENSFNFKQKVIESYNMIYVTALPQRCRKLDFFFTYRSKCEHAKYLRTSKVCS